MARSAPPMQIGCDQVDLWYVPWDAGTAAELESDYRALLPEAEVARCDRFVFAEGRRQCLVSRILVRTVLSSYTGLDLAVWRFAENRYGKPAIAHPADCSIRFNLSHTTGLVVCAVSLSSEVGVDAEDCQRRLADESIAQHYFAPEEVASLERALPDQRRQRFLEFWTLKEAFLKAHGAGLSIPLKDFAFVLPPDQPPQIHFHAPALGDANRWQFLALRLCQRFQVAVAVQRPVQLPLKLRLIETVPLRHTLVRETLAEWGSATDNSSDWGLPSA
jgi:4'-phosphopantetheinyl transferase